METFYNLDTNTGPSMDEMDQFDAFDNYLLTDNNDSNEEDNLFMALDTLDFSDYTQNDNPVYPPLDLSVMTTATPKRSSRGRPGFPIHMHDLLAQADTGGFTAIISWLPHGRAFMVHDMDKLASEVLPKYFNHNKIATFQKQLNAYKFKRFNSGIDKGAYYHECFIRGRVELSAQMTRTKNKHITTTDKEPDFYKLPFVNSDGQEQPKPVPTLPIIQNSNWQQVLKSFCPKPFPEKNLPEKKNIPLPCHLQEIQAKLQNNYILPKSDHPLDSVTFFVPLDLLL